MERTSSGSEVGVTGKRKGDRRRSPFLILSAYRTRDRKQSVALLKQAGETLHLRHFFSLWSLWPLGNLKLDFLALFEGLEAVALDSAIVNKNVRRAGLLDKP